MSSEPYIEMKSIKKVYPDGTIALRGVDFALRKGEIVGLLGENGAGKTTLMKILSGLLPLTDGKIRVGEKTIHFDNPSDALRVGIGMVHQHFALVSTYTPIQNILLGQEAGSVSTIQLFSFLEQKAARAKLAALADEVGLSIPLDTPVELLSLGVRQRVEILKVLYRGTDVLILDEPTSSLTPIEVEELFKTLRKLKEAGKVTVFITHKLKEVLEISDRIVVLRNGLVTGRIQTNKANPEKLALMMIGKEVPRVIREKKAAGEPVLVVKDLEVMSDFGSVVVKDLSFEVDANEILGVAGVEGNGQSELVQALTGLRSKKGGEIRFKDTSVVGVGPKELYKMGLSHIPEDKSRFGLALDFDVSENSILGRQWEPQFLLPLDRLNWKKITDFAQRLVKIFNVVTPSLKTAAGSLSGGNQQRLVVGRELSKRTTLVVAAHPTRGLDIASTLYIRELLVKMRDEGKGVLLISSDLDEIMQLSDRIAVIYEGEFLGVGKAEEFSRKDVGLMMGGVRLKR